MSEDKALATVKKVQEAVESVAEHVQPALSALASQAEPLQHSTAQRHEHATFEFVREYVAGMPPGQDRREALEKGARLELEIEAANLDHEARRMQIRITDPELLERAKQNGARRFLKYTRPVLEVGILVGLVWIFLAQLELSRTIIGALILGGAFIGSQAMSAKLATGETLSLLEIGRLVSGFGSTLVATVRQLAALFRPEKKDEEK